MSWLQLRFTVGRDAAARLADALEVLGAQAVTLQGAGSDSLFDQIDESPTLWSSTSLTALFGAEEDVDRLLSGLQANLRGWPLPAYEVSMLADQDWNRAWMDRFGPMRFGERLWVVPSWHTPPRPRAVNLVLDPGMAFGTGTHPTTALCLEWLDGAGLGGKIVLDYGCGSGILAIAAVRLGARRAIAVDIDPQCLQVTRENARRNGVHDRIDAHLARDWHEEAVDVLLANILAGPLHELAAPFARYVRANGDIVLSGLLAPQAKACLETYAAHFRMRPPRIADEWALLHGTRRAPCPGGIP
ncbi:MAG: Ribosomal protein L11 methyltransferase [Gammaproteobacteria bacterium]|nr:Ribosomal protein L11 methyltransferase [Gammaproteobacteria bacterium]